MSAAVEAAIDAAAKERPGPKVFAHHTAAQRRKEHVQGEIRKTLRSVLAELPGALTVSEIMEALEE